MSWRCDQPSSDLSLLLSAIAMAVSTPLSPLPNHLGDMPLPVSIIPRAP